MNLLKALSLALMAAVSTAHAEGTFDKMVNVNGQQVRLYDAMLASKVNPIALEKAVIFFEQNQNRFSNERYITLIDFSKPSSEKRFYLFDLETGKWERHLVAHGQGSGGLYANNFSNNNHSHMSSLGFYSVAETYYGKHGRSVKLDGLSKLNHNARSRAVVIHPAGMMSVRKGGRYVRVPYVSQDVISAKGQLGRSWGCPALDPAVAQSIINRIKGGSMMYAFNKGSLKGFKSTLEQANARMTTAPAVSGDTKREVKITTEPIDMPERKPVVEEQQQARPVKIEVQKDDGQDVEQGDDKDDNGADMDQDDKDEAPAAKAEVKKETSKKKAVVKKKRKQRKQRRARRSQRGYYQSAPSHGSSHNSGVTFSYL